jgi:ribosomal protein S18 acetylase RimI-like enzyme
MAELRIRPMTPAEFEMFRAESVRGYAAAQVEAGSWPAEGAEGRAEEQTAQLLPRGLETPGMLLLTGEDPAGEPVGMVWIALRHEELGTAWIFQITVAPAHRGKGYGRALLRAAEAETARRGGGVLGLNVHGGNHVARALYESSGYEIASLHMRKPLTTVGLRGNLE